MSKLSIDLPTDVLESIEKISAQMRITPEAFAQMALSFFMQQNIAQLVVIALERIDDGAQLLRYSNSEESNEPEFSIHPDAKEELEQLDTDQQTALLESLLIKVTALDQDENHDYDQGLDLVLQHVENGQLLFSRLAEIDIIYMLSEKSVTVYLLHPFVELESFSGDFDLEEDQENQENQENQTPLKPYRHH